MNNAEHPALHALHVYGTPALGDEDAVALPYYNIYRQTDTLVYSLMGYRQECRSLQPGLYITSGRKMLYR